MTSQRNSFFLVGCIWRTSNLPPMSTVSSHIKLLYDELSVNFYLSCHDINSSLISNFRSNETGESGEAMAEREDLNNEQGDSREESTSRFELIKFLKLMKHELYTDYTHELYTLHMRYCDFQEAFARNVARTRKPSTQIARAVYEYCFLHYIYISPILKTTTMYNDNMV